MTTEHLAIGIFDPDLFIGDLVEQRPRYCSSFLVHAVLCYAVVGLKQTMRFKKTLTKKQQPFATVRPDALALGFAFWTAGNDLWQAHQGPATMLDIAALQLMIYCATTMGLDKEGQKLVKACGEATEQTGLCRVVLPAASDPEQRLSSDEMRFMAHIAWGRFIAARYVMLTCISQR